MKKDLKERQRKMRERMARQSKVRPAAKPAVTSFFKKQAAPGPRLKERPRILHRKPRIQKPPAAAIYKEAYALDPTPDARPTEMS